MEKVEIYKQILNDCCDPTSIREKLKRPFFDGIDNCATDCYLLFRVKPSASGGAIESEGPKRLEFKPDKTAFQLPVEELVKSFLACKFVDEIIEIEPAVPCEECDGDGIVTFEYHASNYKWYYIDGECPVCGGSGNKEDAVTKKTGRKVPSFQEDFITINDVPFDSYRLHKLAEICHKLEVEKIKVTTLQSMNGCVFQLNEDSEVILMPMYDNGALNKVYQIKMKEWK